MAYSSHDPRKDIRSTIGTSWWIEGTGSLYTINVIDDNLKTVRVPIFMSEEVKTESIKEMPYITMNLALCTYEAEDIGARTRKAEAYIDIGVWFADTDNIDSTSFGKKVLDEIVNQVRTHQRNCTFPNTITFAIIKNIQCLEERKAHQVVFHIVAELYVLYYDLC